MEGYFENRKVLGINGMGRIGKLVLWHNLSQNYFQGYVINTGRKVGAGLQNAIDYLMHDSTYGDLGQFLYGFEKRSELDIHVVDEEKGKFTINGIPINLLTESRNPREIQWAGHDVRIVVECTGKFLDPTEPADEPKGSLRGHLEAGAEKVIVSAPFKSKDESPNLPPDAGMCVYGINHMKYKPHDQHILSAASCTTTGLAHMMKPLLETEETSQIITASMSTVHAVTNNQSVLDAVPQAKKSDLRRSRSVFNNIIPTSTGAATAVEHILPEICHIGFMADSVRVPIATSSLITLNVTFHSNLSEEGSPIITRDLLNHVYKRASQGAQKEMLVFSEKQNVSSDMIGFPAAIIIEGVETHTRTGFMPVYAKALQEYGIECSQDIQIPVTHAKVFGWYDNEMGSYVHFLNKLVNYVDQNI